jgi:hypothetical protein
MTASHSEAQLVPVFLGKLRGKTISDGDPLTLEVEVIGSPEPTVRWLRDGLDLPVTLTSTQYDGRLATLKVDEMGVEDEGVFEVVAENPAGKASLNARITVQSEFSPPRPVQKNVLSAVCIVRRTEGTRNEVSIVWTIRTSSYCLDHSLVASKSTY